MSLFIMGDSHVHRLRLTVPFDISLPQCYWWTEPYPDGYEKPTCEHEHLYKAGGISQEIYFSAHKGKSAYSSEYFFNTSNLCIKKTITDDMTILPFFGYIDAKIQLVKYKNPKEAVQKYIHGFLNGFPKNKIRFLSKNEMVLLKTL